MEITEERLREIIREEISTFMADRATIQLLLMEGRSKEALTVVHSMNKKGYKDLNNRVIGHG